MTRTITPRLRTLVLLLLAVTGALFAGAAPASAHAALTGSDPAQGVVVDRAPTQVSLTFSEQVAMGDNSLRVLDPKGKPVQTGKPANVSGTTYAVRLHAGLADGTYTVAYQVVSADSHPVAGAYTFSIGAPSRTVVSDTGAGAGGGAVGRLYAVGRYLSYAGFIVLAGGAAFVLACWRQGAGVRALQRLVVGGWLTLTAATLGLLLLRGSYTSSGKLGDIFDLDLLGQVLQTKTGAALVSRLLLLAAAALFVAVLFGAYARREEEEGTDEDAAAERRDLGFGLAIGGIVVAAGLAASWAMAEHASTGLQPGIAMPVDIVHLIAVACWFGGLTALLVALYRAPADTPLGTDAVRRFSRLAFGSVLALVATGIYQSWRQLGSWSAFTDTRYGQLLLVKLGLVAVMVGLAWISRRWTGRLAKGGAAEEAAEAAADAPQAEAEEQAPLAATVPSGAATAEAGRGGQAGKGEASTATAEPTGDERAGAHEQDPLAATATGAERSDVPEQTPRSTTVPAGAVAAGQAGKGEASAGVASSADADADPGRAAQLARQRVAVEAARRKRVRDSDPSRAGLRRSVLAEAGVAVVLLAVTTALTQTEPGRTEQEARAATAPAASSPADTSGALTLDMPFDTGGKNGKGLVRIDLDPARVGANEMHLYVQRPDGRPYDIPEVKVALTLKAKKIGPLPVAPEHITTGHWAASGVQVPMAGDWEVAVTVRTSDIDQVTVSKNAQIG
ncbi:copper resistance CopC/CopD family protein [Streptomyces sp. NRRL F-2799]|uniref:copper resistance CopC/CopD family protein n=1 Tax=Streptomyces sp. NRRL F-2799 TaxID=1463844 RepID=UPI0004C5B0E6|nr:copper resistance protein CopC [Streptomyces sp. NRRL F-2799]